MDVHLNIPMTAAKVWPQGIAADTCQLLILPGKNGDDSIRTIAIRVRALFDAPSLVVVFLNPFGPIPVGEAPPTVVGDHPCVRIQSDLDHLASALAVDCEQIVVFPTNSFVLDQLKTRLGESRPSWRTLSNETFIGSLTHAKDIIDPFVAYESTYKSIEVLGSEGAVRDAFNRVCSAGLLDS